MEIESRDESNWLARYFIYNGWYCLASNAKKKSKIFLTHMSYNERFQNIFWQLLALCSLFVCTRVIFWYFEMFTLYSEIIKICDCQFSSEHNFVYYLITTKETMIVFPNLLIRWWCLFVNDRFLRILRKLRQKKSNDSTVIHYAATLHKTIIYV